MPPVDRFWADPFLARDGDRLWVFFEELAYAAPKGKIPLPFDRRRRADRQAVRCTGGGLPSFLPERLSIR